MRMINFWQHIDTITQGTNTFQLSTDAYLIGNVVIDITVFELGKEAWVLAPEEADVGDGIKFHSQSLQPQTKCPANLVTCTR